MSQVALRQLKEDAEDEELVETVSCDGEIQLTRPSPISWPLLSSGSRHRCITFFREQKLKDVEECCSRNKNCGPVLAVLGTTCVAAAVKGLRLRSTQ